MYSPNKDERVLKNKIAYQVFLKQMVLGELFIFATILRKKYLILLKTLVTAIIGGIHFLNFYKIIHLRESRQRKYKSYYT
ncbi:hypothetical protein C1N73_08610 [Priestia aryabhattai]